MNFSQKTMFLILLHCICIHSAPIKNTFLKNRISKTSQLTMKDAYLNKHKSINNYVIIDEAPEDLAVAESGKKAFSIRQELNNNIDTINEMINDLEETKMTSKSIADITKLHKWAGSLLKTNATHINDLQKIQNENISFK